MQTKRLCKKIIVLTVNISMLVILLLIVSLYSTVAKFEDPGLEAAIRQKLDTPNGLILRTNLKQITQLDANGHNIKCLEGIENLSDLVSLNLENNQVEDLSPLKHLDKLSQLNISNNKIPDLGLMKLETLQYLPLRVLNLSNNKVIEAEGDFQGISDLGLLRFFSSLERLDLSGNQVIDIIPLRELTNLRVLNLSGNQIIDIRALNDLRGLEELNLRENRISDLTPLSGLNDLRYLNLHSNREVTSLKPIANLTGLKTLIMPNIPIGDQLAYLRNLTNLQRLNVRNCGIKNTSILLNIIASGALQNNPQVPQERAFLDIRDNPLDPDIIVADSALCDTWNAIDNHFHYLLPSVCRIEPPLFSHLGGFYNESFQLSITHPDPDVKIIYTLDGSDPDIRNLKGTTYMYKNQYPMGPPLYNSYTSHIYSESIEINDRSEEPDKLTQITTTPKAYPRYIPVYPVFKGTVLRAKAYKSGSFVSESLTQTFFISKRENKFSLPVISLSIQEDRFFDYYKGIYVPGYNYDNPKTSSETYFNSNYYKKGYIWESPGNFEYFPVNKHHSQLNQKVGIRINGAFTRAFPMKSLRIYSRDYYGDSFKYNFFNSDKSDTFKSIILRNSGNEFWGKGSDIGTMFRDAAIQKIAENLNFDTQNYSPSIVFINGEYWGIHNIRERYDKYFFAKKYGVDPYNIDIITGNAEVIEGDDVHYKTTLAYIDQYGLSEEKHYNYIKTKIDIENFADYQIANIYVANIDWPGNNNDCWRLRNSKYLTETSYGHDGRWRWMVYDTESGFGFYSNYSHNTLSHATKEGNKGYPNPDWSTFLLRNLLENNNFRSYFINRFADLLNTAFLPERVTEIIHKMKMLIEPEIPDHIERWRYARDITDWHESVTIMTDFAQERPAYQLLHILEHFDIKREILITLDVSHTSHGSTQINTIEIDENLPGIKDKLYPWSGIYFSEIPIELKAIPRKGYQFVGWFVEGDIINKKITAEEELFSTEPLIRLTLTTDTTIKAIFR